MSLFIDEVEVFLKAGDGGNGVVTFRREKHVPRGGPNGGDGGRGGSVIFETDPNLSTLLEFRPNKKYKADRGGDGQSNNMFGKDGADLILKVPVGTQVIDIETGDVLADLTHYPQQEVLLEGGKGGRGNSHFTSSVQQTPKFAEMGEPTDEKRVRLELKLLADVGLLGFPNVGKSTLLSRVSAAKPKIADYPFTTLVPNLGVVRLDDLRNFIMADIPGLIENAHQGAGLGIQFLKHLERTRLLVHLVDVSGMTGRDPFEDYQVINQELAAFSERLAKLPQVIVLSRTDIIPEREQLKPYLEFFEGQGLTVFPISAVTGENIEALIYHLWTRLQEIPRDTIPVGVETIGPVRITPKTEDTDPKRYTIERDDEGVLVVKGRGIERMVAMTDMGNEYAVSRLQRRLERLGLYEKLKNAGAGEGDTVRIRDVEFDYIDEDARYDSQLGDDEEDAE
jgi:GTP-binding protein